VIKKEVKMAIKPGEFKEEVIREADEIILRVDCEASLRAPSIEDDSVYMSWVIEKIAAIGNVTKIVFVQKRDYEYDYEQAQILVEIAQVYKKLIRQKDLFSHAALTFGGRCKKYADSWYVQIRNVLFSLLKSDPIGTYVELKRMLRLERIKLEKVVDRAEEGCLTKYIALLNYIIKTLDKTKLIKLARPYLPGHKVGDRDVYRNIFHPIIKPDFMYTKLMATYPADGEEMDNYSIGETEITVFKFPDEVQYLYHMMPPEFKLTEEKYDLLDLARRIMAEHKPKRTEFVQPRRMRDVFFHVGKDLIEELVAYHNIHLTDEEISELAGILVRYTVGFGLIEVLLADEKIQDISVNSPLGRIPLYIVHSEWGDCNTNIMPTRAEAESWASKMRMISGRPLDEANPILDMELIIPGAVSRVSAISPPLDPTGLAFSFRRHRDRPWTLPLFMHYKMINPMAAGLLSFVIDGTRTLLIAGTRSSGKTSFLSSLMMEIMRRYRVITVEDTLELPSSSFIELGFNYQPLKVASGLVKGSSEMSASDGIRSTLRLGDSSLIVGEVRSQEAIALYEAMRVGAAANVVAGTIHGDSPYGVFDRVVNDIGVPATSFKATDVIIICTPIKTAGGLTRTRRVTQITEVRKHWEHDPLLENGFSDLMKYESKTDQLAPSDDLINGESDVLKLIAANYKEFAGNWDAVWENIELRAKIKEAQLNYAQKLNNLDLLEAPFTLKCSDKFHILSEKVREETGALSSKQIFFEWETWLKRELRKLSAK
jgi:type IV secretory pathway ATPase VirB11/archaellum biosynthesis ATPase